MTSLVFLISRNSSVLLQGNTGRPYTQHPTLVVTAFEDGILNMLHEVSGTPESNLELGRFVHPLRRRERGTKLFGTLKP